MLGDELKKNYEYRDKIIEIRDDDHDEIENLSNELEKKGMNGGIVLITIFIGLEKV